MTPLANRTPVTDEQINCSLAVAAVVRAKDRRAQADRALAAALRVAATYGFTESDIEAARPVVSRAGPDAQERITTLLRATGADVRTEQVTERIVADIAEDELDDILFRDGWLAAVWGESPDVSRWTGPDDAWKADRVRQGYRQFKQLEQARARPTKGREG